jgi:hypothetical protein
MKAYLERGMSEADNTIPIEAWNTVLFAKFCRFRYVLTQGLSDHSDELFRRQPYPTGARVAQTCVFSATEDGTGGEPLYSSHRHRKIALRILRGENRGTARAYCTRATWVTWI